MSFDIRESEYPGIWRVTYRGAVDLDIRKEALEESRAILRDKKPKAGLLDFRGAQLELSVEQMYDLVQQRVTSTLFLGVKMALLFNEVPEVCEFEALVTENRGLEMAVFTDETQAFDWLRS